MARKQKDKVQTKNVTSWKGVILKKNTKVK